MGRWDRGLVTTPAPPVAAVLAIDGGNSKTDVALIALDGRLLASARGPGTPVSARTFDKSIVVLESLVQEAAKRAGMEVGGGPVAEHTSAFLAGVDLPTDEDWVGAELGNRGWSPSIRVGNDTFAVLRAGTTRPWGVGVTCGAGINCIGVAPNGETTRFLALGRYAGDWGSGTELGYELMWWATRAEDGRGEPTALSAAIAEHFGRASAADVAIGIHLGEITDDDLIRLTHVLFRVSDDGDPVAMELVDRLAEECSAMANVTLRRLRLTEVDTEVVLGGGILMARNPRLITGIEQRVHAEAPAARVNVVDIPPIAGAALLGLDHLGASPTAHTHLRNAYASGAITTGKSISG